MFTPPPINIIAGAAAIGFSAYSAYNNFRSGRYGAAAVDVLGAIPGAGAASRGWRAARAAWNARSIGKGISKFKGFRGARKLKRQVTNRMHRQMSNAKRYRWYEARWSRWDRRVAYPGVAAHTACKYRKGCRNSRIARWTRLF